MFSSEAYTIHIGMHAGISPAAALDVDGCSEYPEKRRLKNLLHGQGVILYLPAMITAAVIHHCDKYISHKCLIQRDF